jgi:hypothetical protein
MGNSHKNLFRNHWVNCNQTFVEWSLDGPIPKLSKLLSITTQLHCGGHLGGGARLPDTILEEDHPMTILSKFGSN